MRFTKKNLRDLQIGEKNRCGDERMGAPDESWNWKKHVVDITHSGDTTMDLLLCFYG